MLRRRVRSFEITSQTLQHNAHNLPRCLAVCEMQKSIHPGNPGSFVPPAHLSVLWNGNAIELISLLHRRAC